MVDVDCTAQGGLDIFLGLIKESMHKGIHHPLLEPALWGLRNISHGNKVTLTKINKKGGLDLLLDLIRQLKGVPTAVSTLESALACFIILLLGHDANCRKTFKVALDLFLSIAEGTVTHHPSPHPSRGEAKEEQGEAVDWVEYNRYQDDLPPRPTDPPGDNGDKNCVALATSILQLLGPHAYLVCDKCGAKQKTGTQCGRCGKMMDLLEGEGEAQSGVGGHGGSKKGKGGVVQAQVGERGGRSPGLRRVDAKPAVEGLT